MFLIINVFYFRGSIFITIYSEFCADFEYEFSFNIRTLKIILLLLKIAFFQVYIDKVNFLSNMFRNFVLISNLNLVFDSLLQKNSFLKDVCEIYYKPNIIKRKTDLSNLYRSGL